MSKERARRRAERLAVLEREKAARARKVARRQRRRALLRRLAPPRVGRSGQIYRRGRGERIGITLVPLLAVAAVWLLIPDTALRVVLTVLIVLAVPALVVLALGRKAS
jgi:Flp pilus assembly protein TadB